MADTSSGITESQFSRNVTAALAMAGLCVVLGIHLTYLLSIYLITT